MILIPLSHLLPATTAVLPTVLNFTSLQYLAKSKQGRFLSFFPPHIQDLHHIAYMLAAGVQQRFHQRNVFIKRCTKISSPSARESYLLSKLQSNVLFKICYKSKIWAHWSTFSESLGTSTSAMAALFTLLGKQLCHTTEELLCYVVCFLH